jgi:hypothetical protein
MRQQNLFMGGQEYIFCDCFCPNVLLPMNIFHMFGGARNNK